ncbi:hypothetical protein [Bradyrhizobium cenepequi]|uniref:hypothetical protein n=1 Tax=Bradyrhizobium cenepequi TaxID=2821403 RepID=UPI001CE29D63|nr:hypothetical protein [Bradyrhizobium cenepequi]
MCRALCTREGHCPGGYSGRGISGASTANRAGFQQLMRDARSKKFDVVGPHATN